MVAGMADGEPGWLAGLDNGAARLLAHQGLAASIALTVVFALIALAVFRPRRRCVRPWSRRWSWPR